MAYPLPPGRPDEGYWRWFAFWAQFVVFTALTVIGLYVAGRGDTPGDYWAGLLLALGAIALAFMRLKLWFDGGAAGWSSFLFVDTVADLAIVVPLFVVLALAGLFVAAGAQGSLHDGGIAFFVASGLVIFLSLKRVFDKLDSDG